MTSVYTVDKSESGIDRSRDVRGLRNAHDRIVPFRFPFISAGERSIVPTCHASTAREHLISFDPACPPLATRDELPSLAETSCQ